LGIAPLLQPVEATTNVNDALANGVERPADIGGKRVIGAANLSGHANVVVGHRQAEDGNAQKVQDLAQPAVSDGVRVPVWQENDARRPLTGNQRAFTKLFLGITGYAPGR